VAELRRSGGSTYDIIDTRTVYQDRILTLQLDRYVENGSEERTYTRLELGDWVNVLQNNRVHTYLAFPATPVPDFKSSEGSTVLMSPEE
jgi:hypothetical protein